MRPLFALLLLAVLTPAAPVPKGMKAKPATLVGTWKPADKGTCWFQFNDDGTLKTWHVIQGPIDSQMEWTWAIDPEATAPKRVTLTQTNSGGYKCVYELDGDQLKVAFVHRVKGELLAKWDETPDISLHTLTRDTDTK